jgi:4-methyl-5(b-hydroxyethyl)-thiazole monophosphate biosynthesis
MEVLTAEGTAGAAPKRVLVLLYDTFAEFEVAVLLTALRGTPHEVVTVGPGGRPVRSTGLLTVVPDLAVEQVDAAAVDALVIPGGDAAQVMDLPCVRDLVREVDAREGLLAAICGGPAVLGAAGALDGRCFTAALGPEDAAWPGVASLPGRRAELLVTDGHVLTATGSSYVAFAEAVLGWLDDGSVADLSFFREPSLA